MLTALAACVDPVADRFELGRDVAAERFGEDRRLGVSIDSGLVISVTEDGDAFAADLRATGPFPDLAFDNGTPAPVALTVTLENVDAATRLVPIIGALSESSRRDPSCAAGIFADRPDTYLAPIVPDAAGPTTVSFVVSVPRCATVRVEGSAPTDLEAVSVAIIGAVNGDPSYLADAMDAAIAAGADHVQFLGNLAFADDRAPFESVQAAADATALPYGVTVGAREARSGAEALIRTLGPPNFVADVGRARMLVLDTGSARLSDEQMAFVDAIPVSRPPGFVATYQSPMAFGTTDGLRSEHQGSRLLDDLKRRGFAAVVATGGPIPDRRTIGGVTLHDVGVGGHGQPERQIALVTVLRPWPALDPCTTSVDCAGDALCDRGFCRLRCTDDGACGDRGVCDRQGWCRMGCATDTDCPGPVPTCGAGQCALDPEIIVQPIAF